MHDAASPPQQEQPMIDLTAPPDVTDRDTTQPRDEDAPDRDNSNELIDLTEDSTAASSDQNSGRNPGEEQQVSALQSALDQANKDLAAFRDCSRRILDEQEAALTCPISYELFENPVVTSCCGKTFSSEALTEVLRWNPQCPVCRSAAVRTHASRDMTSLVELYQKQRSILAPAEAKGGQESTESAERASGQRAPIRSKSRRKGRVERRSQRVIARAAVILPATAPGAPAPARAQTDGQGGDSDGDWQDEYLWWLQN